jgi:hypothetical protein
MTYREFLVMRKALLWFIGCTTGLMLLMVIVQFSQYRGGNLSTDLNELHVPVAWVVTIFAAIFGVALGNASREPARVFWVLPSERWKLALQIVAVDAAGIVVAYAGVLAAAVAFFLLAGLFEPANLRGSIDWAGVARSLVFVYAVYGWSALVGILGRRVAYCGLASLPFLLLWTMFSNVRGAFGELVRLPILVNPFSVYAMGFTLSHPATDLDKPMAHSLLRLAVAGGWETPILLATALLTCAIAVVLWQRAEVLSA